MEGGGGGGFEVALVATPAYEQPFLLPMTVQGAAAGGGGVELSADETMMGSST